MGVLVEKMLDVSKYKKWNSNNGYVDGLTGVPDAVPDISDEETLIEGMFASLDLGAIAEGDEEEESESDRSCWRKILGT